MDLVSKWREAVKKFFAAMKEKLTGLKGLSKRTKILIASAAAVILVVAIAFLTGVFQPVPVMQAAGPQVQTQDKPDVSEADPSSAAPEADTQSEAQSEAEENAPVFPKGATINEIDVSGMTAKECRAALDKWALDYSLTLTVNGKTRTYQADAFGISFAEADIEAMIAECETKGKPLAFTVENPIAYNEAQLQNVIDNFPGANDPAKNARLSYSSNTGAFVLLKEETGSRLEMGTVKEAVVQAILNRLPSVTETVKVTQLKPEISIESDEAQKALSYANSLLEVKLKYTYAPEGKKAATETISKNLIASWLSVGSDGLSISISSSSLSSYCDRMSDKHSVSGTARRRQICNIGPQRSLQTCYQQKQPS